MTRLISRRLVTVSVIQHPVSNSPRAAACSADCALTPRPRAWSTRSPARQAVRSTLDKPTCPCPGPKGHRPWRITTADLATSVKRSSHRGVGRDDRRIEHHEQSLWPCRHLRLLSPHVTIGDVASWGVLHVVVVLASRFRRLLLDIDRAAPAPPVPVMRGNGPT